MCWRLPQRACDRAARKRHGGRTAPLPLGRACGRCDSTGVSVGTWPGGGRRVILTCSRAVSDASIVARRVRWGRQADAVCGCGGPRRGWIRSRDSTTQLGSGKGGTGSRAAQAEAWKRPVSTVAKSSSPLQRLAALPEQPPCVRRGGRARMRLALQGVRRGGGRRATGPFNAP
jgi:hypothetical protein